MSNFLYLTGARMNKFGRGQSTGISPAVHAVSSVANAYDNDPSSPVIFGSVAANSYLTTNVDALANSGFETALPSGWTDGSSGGGAFTRTTVGGEFVTGSAGGKFVAGAGVAYCYQDITVSAGEYRQIGATVKNNGAGSTQFFIVGNLKTGNYWNGSAWSAGFQGATITETGSFVAYTQTYQVESFDACMSDTVTLRVGFYCSAGTCYADDMYDVPGLSFFGIFGHNLGNVVTSQVVNFLSSTDRGSTYAGLGQSATLKRGSFFVAGGSLIYSTDWKVLIEGTPHEAPWFGEIVLGQYSTSTTSPMWGLPKTRAFPASRARGQSGRAHVYNYATDPPQDIEMTFSPRTAAAALEIENIWLRSGQGLYPFIAVPISTETDVYYGRLMEPITQKRPFSSVYDTTLTLVGDPLPTVGL